LAALSCSGSLWGLHCIVWHLSLQSIDSLVCPEWAPELRL